MVAWNDNEVKINDTYEMAGTKYACVEALEGEPFVGGDTYPVATRYGIVPVSELQLIARGVYFNHWTGISIHRNGTTRKYGKGRKWEKALKAICQRDRIRASFFPGGVAFDI